MVLAQLKQVNAHTIQIKFSQFDTFEIEAITEQIEDIFRDP